MSRSRSHSRIHIRQTHYSDPSFAEPAYSDEDISVDSREEDEDEWSDEDDVEPSDSASVSPPRHPPADRGPRRVPSRRHIVPRTASHYDPRPQPNPPTSLDSSDYYEYGAGGAYPPPGAPYYGGRGGYAPSHPGGYGGPYSQQVVPYGPPGFNQNPFAPGNGSGSNFFNGEHRWPPGPPGGPGEMMPYGGGQNYFGGPGYPPIPHNMQQYQWQPPPPPPTELIRERTPAPPEPPKEDPEKEAMKKRLADIEAEAKRKEAEAKQKEMEARIKKEAEEAFQRRMDEMKREEMVRAEERRVQLEAAQKQIEDAKKEAAIAAREAVEAERKAEAERIKREQEAIARAERVARDTLEAERKAEEARQKSAAEAAALAEAQARAKVEAAIKAEQEAKAAAEKKAAEEAEWRKHLEEEAKLKAMNEARAKIEEEKKAAEAAKAAEDAKKKEEETFKKKALEEAKVKAAEEAAKKKEKAPVRFKDAVGRKFSFPFHLCQTWAGMEELIKQAFIHVDVIGHHVQQGHYDLVGPNGEIILPQVWEKVIEPDWAITMHMWPMDRQPQAAPGRGGPPGPPGMQGRFPPQGMPMMGRRPGGVGGGPPPPPGPGGHHNAFRPGPMADGRGNGPPPNMPAGVNIVNARPPKKSSKPKPTGGMFAIFGPKPKHKSGRSKNR